MGTNTMMFVIEEQLRSLRLSKPVQNLTFIQYLIFCKQPSHVLYISAVRERK